MPTLVESINKNSYPGLSRASNDFGLDVSRSLIDGYYAVNKFGRAPNGVQTTLTDIWARSDGTASQQQIWLAPTASRIHAIQSDSANDTTGGTGIDTVIIWYLPDWGTKEQKETVIGNLNAGVVMTNSAVMINRMRAIAQSTTTSASGLGMNKGTINATAAVDGTISATILPNKGQTQLAFLGIPSVQNFYMARMYANMLGGTNLDVDVSIAANVNPDLQSINFITQHTFGLQSSGTSGREINFNPPKKEEGPCLLKMQAIASSNDLDLSAGFDGYLIDN